MAKKKDAKRALTLEERRRLFKEHMQAQFDAKIFSNKDEGIILDRLSLDMPPIDEMLGGGLPKGRIIEIYGQESAGKSTFCLETIKQSQLEDPNNSCLFIDAENALDYHYAINGIGIDSDRFDVLSADDLSQGLTVLGSAAESGIYSVIVFDSTAVKVKDDGTTTNYTGNDSGIGHEARMLSACLGKLVHPVAQNNTIVIFTSQMRSKIGVFYGNPNIPTGGNALKFYASVRMEIRRKTTEKVGDDAISNRVVLKTVKNKTFMPYRECEFSIVFGEGFDRIEAHIAKAVEAGIISQSGSWYKYNGENIAQGYGNLRQLLKDNSGLLDEIVKATKSV